MNIYFSHACGIELESYFVITGGKDNGILVSRYSSAGWENDLPSMNDGRQDHGCSKYTNKYGEVLLLLPLSIQNLDKNRF